MPAAGPRVGCVVTPASGAATSAHRGVDVVRLLDPDSACTLCGQRTAAMVAARRPRGGGRLAFCGACVDALSGALQGAGARGDR